MNNIAQLETHEYANIFPMMNEGEYAALVGDMKANGYDPSSPIVLFQNKILDGRNRYKAARELGVSPVFNEFEGVDPLSFVIRHNLTRRHLNESQRAMIAASLANMQVGGNGNNQHKSNSANLQNSKVSQTQAAHLLNVSPRSVANAAKIKQQSPELVSAIQSGELTVSRAVLEINRKEKIDAIVANNEPLTTGIGQFNILLVDPPWRYEHIETESRAIENQYPTMSLQEICDLPIDNVAADECVLFMWATSPKLAEAIQVLNAWKFNYRTCAVWVKDKIGMGYYFRQRHELLLVATRGNLPTPEPANRPDSVIEAQRLEHSQKPEGVYELIERMYPEFVKCELFARHNRKGWQAWGNQS